MKYILKITIFFSLFFSVKSFAQLDTLNYVKQFEVNKVNYIGQPFSKILNDMTQMQPKLVWFHSPFNDKNVVTYCLFNFSGKSYAFSHPTILVIEWQNPIQKSDALYYRSLNSSYFTNDEKNFYGSKIVGDVQVYEK